MVRTYMYHMYYDVNTYFDWFDFGFDRLNRCQTFDGASRGRVPETGSMGSRRNETEIGGCRLSLGEQMPRSFELRHTRCTATG